MLSTLASLALVVLSSSAHAAPRVGSNGSPFDPRTLAGEVLAAHGLADVQPEHFDLGAFLERDFVRVRLGLFDVHLEARSANTDAAADFKVLSVALLDAQAHWLSWLDAGPDAFAQERDDVATLRAWVLGTPASRIVAAARRGGVDLLALTSPDVEVAAAMHRFADTMAAGRPLGLERVRPQREPVVLVPDRKSFVSLCSLAGWRYPQQQSTFWQPAVADWTCFYLDQVKFLALEYGGGADWTIGVSMHRRSKTDREQQVVQLAVLSMLDNYYGDRIPPALAGALAVNLVVDLFGECNTRVDGDLRERRAAAVEMFVPAANANGGELPMQSAESRWRANQTSDRFEAVLRHAFKSGSLREEETDETAGGACPRKLGRLVLLGDYQGSEDVVRGPFLGSAAAQSALPEQEFLGDYAEFLRAYGTCFVHWLRTQSAGNAERSAARFGTFLRDLAQADDARAVEAVMTKDFGGAALSSATLDAATLEGRFVRWLAK
jgi:hypothetical protein